MGGVIVSLKPPLEGEIVDRDAIEIGELYERARTSIIDSVRCQIECGQRLTAKKASLKHGEWLPWLEANAGVLGFSTRRTAAMLMKAGQTNEKLPSHLDEIDAVNISRLTWGNNTVRGTTGTGENEWYTPGEYIEAARSVLGDIDLDPATSEQAQEQIRARKFFTLVDDGLKQEWNGRVWLNPPYAPPHIANFVSKMVEERRSGRVTAAIMLTHNYTDTAWFHEAAGCADAICFTRGRVKFYDAEDTIAAPTQGQAFTYFGDEPKRFAEQFSSVGFIVFPWAGEA